MTETATDQGLLGLAIVAWTALVLITYAFLRMAGVIHGRSRHAGGRRARH